MTNIAGRLAKLEAEIKPAAEGRQFTFSGGEPDADLHAFVRTFGVELTDRDQVVHYTITGQSEPSTDHTGDLTLSHCSDIAVVLAYVAKYGHRLVELDGDE